MKNLIKYAFALIVAGLAGTPAPAQSTAVNSSYSVAKSAVIPNYEGVYMVIKADTKPETLTGIEEKFKKVGISFKVNDVIVKDGLITKITVSVDVPGIYNGTITSGNNQEPLASPVYFYNEAGKASLSSGEIPAGISHRGRLVVTDNLNGVAILYNNDSTEFSGSFYTKWKSR